MKANGATLVDVFDFVFYSTFVSGNFLRITRDINSDKSGETSSRVFPPLA